MTDDPFWVAVRTQLDELTHTKTAAEVAAILSAERNPYHSVLGDEKRTFGDDHGFFAGSGGDNTVRDALRQAGWKMIWSEASYYYAMRAPDGSAITYVEGDIYTRDTRDPKVEVQRTWTEVGKEYTDGDMRPKAESAIASLKWVTPEGSCPMSPGLAIKECIKELGIPKVSLVAWESDGLGPYGVYGIEGHYKNGRARVYVLDRGADLKVLCSDLWPKEES